MSAWAGKLRGEAKGAAALMSMSIYLLLQSQLSNLLTASSQRKAYFRNTGESKNKYETKQPNVKQPKTELAELCVRAPEPVPENTLYWKRTCVTAGSRFCPVTTPLVGTGV